MNGPFVSDQLAMLRQRTGDALNLSVPTLALRNVCLPQVQGKAHAVIGMTMDVLPPTVPPGIRRMAAGGWLLDQGG